MKSVHIEPCVVERKTRFIFENKSLFSLKSLFVIKNGQDIGLILKSVKQI